MKKPLAPEERVYRAIRPLMLPYRIWPDPKPVILTAIREALRGPKPKRKEAGK
jgi:hypothetical protein